MRVFEDYMQSIEGAQGLLQQSGIHKAAASAETTKALQYDRDARNAQETATAAFLSGLLTEHPVFRASMVMSLRSDPEVLNQPARGEGKVGLLTRFGAYAGVLRDMAELVEGAERPVPVVRLGRGRVGSNSPSLNVTSGFVRSKPGFELVSKMVLRPEDLVTVSEPTEISLPLYAARSVNGRAQSEEDVDERDVSIVVQRPAVDINKDDRIDVLSVAVDGNVRTAEYGLGRSRDLLFIGHAAVEVAVNVLNGRTYRDSTRLAALAHGHLDEILHGVYTGAAQDE